MKRFRRPPAFALAVLFGRAAALAAASPAVIKDLRAKGAAAVTLDGEMGGLAAMLGGFLQMVPGASSNQPRTPYLTAAGTIRAVEPKPVPYPMIANDALLSLSAWHVKGDFVQAGIPVPVEWYILDNRHNPITLRASFGTDKTDIVRIFYPLDNPTESLKTALAKDHRAVTYGIYFNFNSATIKPQSAAVLMTRNPQWSLTVGGPTDNIGGATCGRGARRSDSPRRCRDAPHDLRVWRFGAARHQHHSFKARPKPTGRTHPAITVHSRNVYP